MRYFFILFCFTNLNAQTVQSEVNSKIQLPIDTIIEVNGNRIHLKKLPGDNQIVFGYKIPDTNGLAAMPNAITQFKDQQKKIGNNKQGFDIYLSQVDNMPILKPDAQNLASLPYAVKIIPQVPGKVSVQIQEIFQPSFKYLKPLSGKEKKLLELFKK